MSMKRIATLACAVLLLAALYRSQASAGQTISQPVTVVPQGASGFAYGALGSTRNTTDSVADIGCTATYTASTASTMITCSAVSTTGVSRSCTVPSTAFVAWNSPSLTDDGFLYFQWDATGACVDIHTYNSHMYEPKLP